MKEREEIRCPSCGMNQFMTIAGNCRRCRKSLTGTPQPAPVEAAVKIEVLRPRPRLVTRGLVNDERFKFALADVLRLARKARGYSGRALSERMRVWRTYISKVENAKATPTVRSLRRYAAALELPADGLLRLAEELAK